MRGKKDPFRLYLARHPDAGSDELKSLFRILAKRTHPDTTEEDETAFVDLQNSYHEAVAMVIERLEAEGRAGSSRSPAQGGRAPGDRSGGAVFTPSTPRERSLHLLYRYKAHLPSLSLTPAPLPATCLNVFGQAIGATREYEPRHAQTLEVYGNQFHTNRATVARYPDVITRYESFLRGLCGFFDNVVMPNRFNERIARSYLGEMRPVTDYDPTTSPELRSNRSAPARAALYRFATWLLDEIELGPCRVI